VCVCDGERTEREREREREREQSTRTYISGVEVELRSCGDELLLTLPVHALAVCSATTKNGTEAIAGIHQTSVMATY
jgi:hypothetical protein